MTRNVTRKEVGSKIGTKWKREIVDFEDIV